MRQKSGKRVLTKHRMYMRCSNVRIPLRSEIAKMPRLMKMGGKCCVTLIALLIVGARMGVAQTKPAPATAPAFDEALKAAEGFKAAAGLKISVFAAEPQLENAVAL